MRSKAPISTPCGNHQAIICWSSQWYLVFLFCKVSRRGPKLVALSINQILDRLTIESARTSPEPKKTNSPFKSVAAACWNQPNFLTHQELSLVPDPSTVMDPGLSRQACKHWRIWRWLWPTSFPIASSHLGNHPIYGEFGFACTEYIYIYITIWQTFFLSSSCFTWLQPSTNRLHGLGRANTFTQMLSFSKE